MTMQNQVAEVCNSTFYHIRNIGAIRRYLTSEATKSLMHSLSLVTSRLDYDNSLLVGLPGSLTQKLERVQSTAARVITRTAKCDHITPVLKELHCLPVEKRIQFKVLPYTHKAIQGEAPVYIKDLVKVKRSTHSLRSGNAIQFIVPSGRSLKTYGDRSFKTAAANLWNELLGHIRNITSKETFKRSLKVYFFMQYL